MSRLVRKTRDRNRTIRPSDGFGAVASDLTEPTNQERAPHVAACLRCGSGLGEPVRRSYRRRENKVASPKDEVNRLMTQLTTLERLDPVIRQWIGPARGDDWRKSDIRRNRALAWLHGWAIFGHLAVEASRTDAAPELRPSLLGGSSKDKTASALGLLTTLHGQIRRRRGARNRLLASNPQYAKFVLHTALLPRSLGRYSPRAARRCVSRLFHPGGSRSSRPAQ